MERDGRVNLWGWTSTARVLLAVLGIPVAVLLVTISPRGVRRPPIDSTLVIDPNTVPRQVLSSLPKIGPAMAGRIVAERERTPFRSFGDLDARVRGVGPATAAAIRPFIRCEPEESEPLASLPR